MLTMNKVKKVATIGLAVTAVVGAGFTAARTAGAEPAPSYCAEMPDAVGLYVGNPVTRMGFPVGRVESIVEKGGHVEVTFSTDGDRPLPADVKAVTRSKSILADRSLELVGNDTSGPTLEPGSCIPLQNSRTPKAISEVVGSAADFIEALSPEGSADTVEMAVAGLDQALRGQGDNARSMMLHAADAMESPDKFVADIGTVIANMAPLSEQALADWAAIKSVVEQMPDVAVAGIDLWPGTIDVCVGIGWLVATLDDIQRKYGGDIWPFVHGQVADAIALAAGRTGEIQSLVATVPSLAAVADQQTRNAGGLTMQYTPPAITLSDEDADRLCALLDTVRPGSCTPTESGARVSPTGLMDLVLLNGAAQ
ncbi:MlaD family protein [Rhodococcus sp. 11-3]|nr:MlaD family protein [Rhodococcus sp. 11-3]